MPSWGEPFELRQVVWPAQETEQFHSTLGPACGSPDFFFSPAQGNFELVLFESSVGFCLFKVADNGTLLTDGNLHKKFDSPASASNLVKLQSIHRFKSTADAVEDLSAIGDGKLSKNLKKFLIDEISGGVEGKEKQGNFSSRGPQHLLLGDYNVDESDLNTMNLGLSHSFESEVNIYAMRVKEWYGWHFQKWPRSSPTTWRTPKSSRQWVFEPTTPKPTFLRFTRGARRHSQGVRGDLDGTEISDSDLLHIQSLASQVISLMPIPNRAISNTSETELTAIAPNLTAILVGSAPGKLKGKQRKRHFRFDTMTSGCGYEISRRSSLIGMEARIKLESRLRRLEQSIGIQSTRSPKAILQTTRPWPYNPAADSVMIPAANNPSTTAEEGKAKKPLIEEITPQSNDDEAEAKRKRKEEKKAKKAARASLPGDSTSAVAPTTEPIAPPKSSSSKDKKRKHKDDDEQEEGDKSVAMEDDQ
ncbi:hypothetical protein PSTT_03189 [Puccinia striiformis]|uniref:Nucleolar protein 58 n=1 Tax=Puccinia striiformis TaxID=27350 RepID=A0A2S4VXB7_9BASI|nr:hypothetical protein PSTT_03189 [Puccinia striiformis]